MGEKMRVAKKFRTENAAKWAKFWDENEGKLSKEEIHDAFKQMRADNEILSVLAKEATKEWLEEKNNRYKLPFD